MPNDSFISPASAIANTASSVPLSLIRLANSEILWINTNLPPNSISQKKSKNILEVCSFVTGPGPSIGWVDRYGGGGIGSNGGSGRSATLGNFSVKGIGPTPLIGSDAPLSHSSGGAFLEEAIREVVTSRLLEKTLPHGINPITAIIGTGLFHDWHVEGSCITEQRVLIVRPFVLRPAHFQRAYFYRPGSFYEKGADIKRVSNNFKIFSEVYGLYGLKNKIIECFKKWSEQIAYALVHGIALGTSSSNVSLDGQILDFGAVSNISHDANYFIAPNVSICAEFDKLLKTIEEVSESAYLFDANVYSDIKVVCRSLAIEYYERRIVSEILVRVGLNVSYKDLDIDDICLILSSYLRYKRQANRIRMDLLPSQYTYFANFHKGLESIWSLDRPKILDGLASVLEKFRERRYKNDTFRPSDIIDREKIREIIMAYVSEGNSIKGISDLVDSFVPYGYQECR